MKGDMPRGSTIVIRPLIIFCEIKLEENTDYLLEVPAVVNLEDTLIIEQLKKTQNVDCLIDIENYDSESISEYLNSKFTSQNSRSVCAPR